MKELNNKFGDFYFTSWGSELMTSWIERDRDYKLVPELHGSLRYILETNLGEKVFNISFEKTK